MWFKRFSAKHSSFAQKGSLDKPFQASFARRSIQQQPYLNINYLRKYGIEKIIGRAQKQLFMINIINIK